MSNLQLNVTTTNDTDGRIDASRVINGKDLRLAAKRRVFEHKRERQWLADAIDDGLRGDLDESALETLIEGND